MHRRWCIAGAAALAVAGLAWGCGNVAGPSAEGPREAGPDYTNFAAPPLLVPMPAAGEPGGPADVVVRAAGGFRMAAAADLDAARRQFPTGSSLDFLAATDVHEAMPEAWAYFFSTTVMLIGNQATAEPVVAYYNPFLDAAVVTRWKIDSQGRPAMAAATFRGAAELESRRLADQPALPRWLCGNEAAPQLLGTHYRAFLKAFAKQFPPAPLTAWDDYAAVSAAALQSAGAMATFQALAMCALEDGPNKALGDSLRELREAVAGAEADRLERLIPPGNPFPVSEIAGWPPPFRRFMAPVFAVWTENQVMVFMGDSRLLRFYTVAAYDVGDTLRLTGFGLCDLAGAGPEAAVADAGRTE